MTKTCMGGHKLWKNVPCHQQDVSCGQKCGKPSNCEMHKCKKVCHKGECLTENEVCMQKCTNIRPDCGHPCNAECHKGICPDTTCKVQVTIHCRCRRKSAQALCMAGNLQSAYQSFNAEILTMQLQNLQSGQSIDISKLTNPEKRPKFLDCDEECSRLERNKRFVEALGIEGAESRQFQQCTIYSDSLKQEARLRLPFIKQLETIFENLSDAINKTGQQQVAHNFQPMNVAQRKIIHELAECYGFKTYSVDQEPKRSTVVVAYKESYMPQIKLADVVEHEVKNLIPSSLNGRGAAAAVADTQTQQYGDKNTLKSILRQQPSGGEGDAGKRVNYFDDDYQH